jgi:hypothetical protein
MDILFGTDSALSRSTVRNRRRAYHGNATEHSEQSEVDDDAHASVTAYRIVRRGSMQRKKMGSLREDRRGSCVVEQKLEGEKTR